MEVGRSSEVFHLQHSERKLSSARETHSRTSLRTLRSISTSFTTSFDRLTSFGNINFDEEVRSKGLGYLKSIVDKNPVFLHLWNEILVMLCVIATSLDPFFCYILLVDEDKRCVGFDKKLRTVVVILRSITDFLYIILIVCHFHFGYSSFYNANPNDPECGVCTRAWRFLFSYFTVDVLSVLPLPQVVVLVAIPSFKRYGFIYAVRSLKYILIVQYLPRVFRIYSFLKKVRWTSSILPETAGAKAAFNLFLYMLASHVIGAFWYLFTIERKTTCWEERYPHWPLNCKYVVGNLSADNFCSPKAENAANSFDFGIFKEALPIVESKDFIKKTSLCYWWGLQKLSSLGQDLKTSYHLWEVYFAVTITVSGLVLFALLVGNLQTYLQSTIARLEEMRLKGQDIELWMAYHSLPPKLKKKIKKYERYKWRETKGVDVEQLLHNLPRDLRRDTKRHLCLTPLLSVSKFQNMDDKLLNAICDYLKPVLYIERNLIVQEGEPLDEIVFIIRGKVMIYSKRDSEGAAGSSGSKWLTKGDFYGEDLLDWALRNPTSTTVPISTKTMRAHSKVEAFVLMANDLKTVVTKFWWLFSRNSPSLKAIWAPWAALALQLAWRRYHKSKMEKDKCKSPLAIERRNAIQNSNAPLLNSTYLVRALRALKLKAKKAQAESSRV
ncbi:cyclic nucleotide-gated ion channel 1-like [Benincasa hispida]|uniref:cyclic nucleotide-gated ion channel 1-like n=1 Tax=Benincasa hispida TaxID=102211 RepID=UPI001902BD34|nr:cyclic nucleotide-gated ion channel 1-like [Benincasa hispida]XP_038904379.1 cyclic nucleotide-gated ion channel 1-like [Benincasa hispida]XP_038904383.1 cyclic nucleotide-gated ion channel 1-like [Benincasa hispida]XP_038904388.1 cyclic nucleotide-gated ion channel 1-like [Benincasa hispida]